VASHLIEETSSFTIRLPAFSSKSSALRNSRPTQRHFSSDNYLIVLNDDEDDEPPEDDEEEDDEEEDPYTQKATSEFVDDPEQRGSLVASSGEPTTAMDWGGALGRLRERMVDIESGKSQDPSHALFRLMSSQSPNQAIGSFISQAKPQVISAMSGAVGSLLGGLSNPQSGTEMIIKASGEKIGSLCFQLQMTGYMFRNAEYVMSLKELMNLRGSATLQDYEDAFHRLDKDGSGFIETADIRALLDDVYDGKTPAFEVKAFLKFFDINNDGKISWKEFERGLGTAMAQQNQMKSKFDRLLTGSSDDDDEDHPEVEPDVTGEIEVELDDGKIVKLKAKEYIKSLKEEAQALKEALRREKVGYKNGSSNGTAKDLLSGAPPEMPEDGFGGIVQYIASRQGDLKSLTEGISPEIVATMKKLVDFVLEGGESGKGKDAPNKAEMEMEIPGSALQQLALWQLILGYRLREQEAKGDYLKLLE